MRIPSDWRGAIIGKTPATSDSSVTAVPSAKRPTPLPVKVERWDPEKDGKFSEAALRRKIEKQGCRVSRYVYPPGTYFSDHTHEIDKIDAVVSGRFRMKMKGFEVVLEAGDSLEVPRGTIHSAEVVGNEPVVSLDAARA